MSDTKLPILQTTRLGWRDGFQALGKMPKMAATALIIIIVCSFVFSPLMPKNPADKSLDTKLLSFGLTILGVFFLAPIAIAVHRYVLLDEITETYFPDPSSRRFRSFFVLGVLLEAIWIPQDLVYGFSWSFSLVLGCLTIFVSTRLIMLFPAIAIDGPGANLAGAWQKSSGHFWSIFATLALSLLSGLLVVGLLSLIPVALTIAFFPLLVIAIFVAAALASHLYRALVAQPQPRQPLISV